MKIIDKNYFSIAQKVSREAVANKEQFDWACAMVLLRYSYGLPPEEKKEDDR